MFAHVGGLQYFAIINNAKKNNLVPIGIFLLSEVYRQGKFIELGLLHQKVNIWI